MKKILAIDDHKDNLTTIKAVIKSNIPACKVLIALSGKEGLKTAKEEQPDTILLDIIMPQIDGYEVCKKLKEDESTKHIPVIMLTAIKTDSESRIKGLEIGADAFLSKPIDPVELSAQVKVMLRIKEAEDKLRAEKVTLEELVLERTYKLKESEKKYRALFDNAPLAYQSLDESGCFLDVNPTWLTILGYEREEIIGKCFGDFLHPDWKPHFEKNFPVFKKQGYVHDIQFKISHKDGHYLDISFEGCISYHPDGSIKQTYCVFQDITEQKKAEEEIRKLSIAVQQSPSVIAITDLKGNLEYVNPKFTELTGYTFKEALGKNPRILKSGKQPDDIYKQLWETISSGIAWHGEFHNKKKNGELFWEAASISPIFDKQGRKTNYIKVAEDITKRKHAEKELKDKIFKLQQWHKLTVGREIKMIELKKEINELLKKAEQPAKYMVSTKAEI